MSRIHRSDWAGARAALRVGNALERLRLEARPLSVFELRAAVARDAEWNPDVGDANSDAWAAAYDRRGLLNFIVSLEREQAAAGRQAADGGLTMLLALMRDPPCVACRGQRAVHMTDELFSRHVFQEPTLAELAEWFESVQSTLAAHAEQPSEPRGDR